MSQAAAESIRRESQPESTMGPGWIELVLAPLHRWIWSEPHRCVRKLLAFSLTEADSGRDMCRAAELTGDPRLRRLYLRHSLDESRHAELFRTHALELRSRLPRCSKRGLGWRGDWIAPGERGLDDLEVEALGVDALLAFVHLSERAGARRFAAYQRVLPDGETRRLFERVCRDETFHTAYTRSQLARFAGDKAWMRLLRARTTIVWRRWLRLGVTMGSIFGTLFLLAQYFLIVPWFAWRFRSAPRAVGWRPYPEARPDSLHSQY